MRLVVDLQCLQIGSNYRGIGRYGRAVTRALLRNCGDHEIWVAVRNDADVDELRQSFSDLLPAERFRVFSLFENIAFTDPANDWRRKVSERLWAFSLSLLRPDFVLCPSIMEGFGEPIATTSAVMAQYEHCAVLHDLIPYHDPMPYVGGVRNRQWYLEKLAHLLRCEFLFANSDYTRSDFLECMNFPADRIVTAHSAGDFDWNRHTASEAGDDPIKRLHLEDGYFLFAGSLEPRKNVDLLIRAFALLPDHYRAKKKIVLAGKIKGHDQNRIVDLAKGLKLDTAQVLVFAGYLPDNELRELYRQCDAFVFPSFSEGFGAPVIEAMSAGAPVLSSDRTSLPEVVGRADMLFDPDDPIALRDMLVALLEKPERRAELAAYGLERAKFFSWDKSARKILLTLEDRLSKRPKAHPQIAGRECYLDYVRTVQAVADILGHYQVEDAGRQTAALLLQANMDAASDLFDDEPALPLRWQIEGPFDSSYSLALVNRETARGLTRQGVAASLFSTEGPGDFDPDKGYLERNPDIEKLYERSAANGSFSVVSRNLFPPRVSGMRGAFNLIHHYACEEAGFSKEWMSDFNASLNGMTCVSRHVRKIMIDYGLRLPIAVTGLGVEHWDRTEASGDFRLSAKGYRFLHVSSAIPRKGVDCLLAGFGKAYRKWDDVSLVIKTASNTLASVTEELSRLRAADPDYPDVVLIDRDLRDGEMKSLYSQCHAMVLPSRAEGFGLPAAEAMLQGLPVIVTGWSGYLDFCDNDTAWLIDYRFARARTHHHFPGAVSAEPDIDHLAALMRELRGTPQSSIVKKTKAASARLRSRFTWDQASWRLQSYIAALAGFSHSRHEATKVAWVSTWNTRCGLATYSQYMLGNRPDVQIFAPLLTNGENVVDGPNVARNWKYYGDPLEQLHADIVRTNCNVVVVQLNYSPFSFPDLVRFLERLIDQARVVVVEIHATHETDPNLDRRLSLIAGVLKRCDRLLVHSIRDMNRLKDMGITENVTLFRVPYVPYPADAIVPSPLRERVGKRRVIASYGFFLSHKGLPELLEAFGNLVREGLDGHLLLVNAEYPVGDSHEIIGRCKARVAELGLNDRVTLVTEFLPDEVSLGHLQLADLIVLPYQKGTTDSASGAIRLPMVSGRPVAVTPLSIFEDAEDAVLQLPGGTIEELTAGIRDLLADIAAQSPNITAAANATNRLIDAFSRENLGTQLFGMLHSLRINRDFDAFCGIESGNPRLAFPATYTFSSTDPRMRTTVGQRDNAGVLRSTARDGALTFGPYIPLTAGRYRLRAFGTNGTGKARLRVISSQGGNLLHECTIGDEHFADGCLFDTEFELDSFHNDVEFLLSVSADTEMGLSAFVLDCRYN